MLKGRVTRCALAATAFVTGLGVSASAIPASASAATAPVASTATATFTGHGSLGQAYELGAAPGTQLSLVDSKGRVAGTGVADQLGSLIIRDVRPGPGYTFRESTGPSEQDSAPFRVLGVKDIPPQSFYDQQSLHEGLNYITMRDGVKLAATVRLPPGKTLADGPFPTVIEDSGYAIAAPHSLIDEFLNHGSGGNDPLAPDTATAVGSAIAPLLGFATVSLQMRGSGCSGGAFGLFDLPTIYDGYDAVEIAAAQPWVKNHKVGLVGISFSGISQLFVAGTRPPHLAAIAPLSVTDDLYSTGFPGGIFNQGFAASWVAQRQADAQPAPAGGQLYARVLIEQGDMQCLANQALRLQTQDAAAVEKASPLRVPSLYDPRSPSTWAAHIDAPVFLVGSFQDEQTGGQWPAIVSQLSGDPDVWVTLDNGTHVDSLGPATITRWLEFLDIFVADSVPTSPGLLGGLSGVLYQTLTGAPSEPLPPVRFTNAPDVATARAQFETDPRVRVLFDNGGGSLGPGAMQPVWEQDFASWPPPPAVTAALDLGPGGTLTSSPPPRSTVSYRPDPSARPSTDLPSGNVWSALPPYDWTPVTGSEGLGFLSAPLTHDLVVAGPAALDLHLRTTAPDTDLQVTVSEVRPDGRELFINTGVVRASLSHVNSALSTPTAPVLKYLAVHPLRSGSFNEVVVPIVPFAYAFRAGSRIRVTIDAPGGDRPAWAFATYQTNGDVTNTVELGGPNPSALQLSVLPDVTAPDTQPACPSLRGQPCRTFVAAGNGG